MFTWSPSAEQQRQLAERLTTFLSPYGYLSDSYIIEFFSKDHWHSLPTRWQSVLQDLTSQQVADLLLDRGHGDRRYPSPWPLSLLAFRATAHALAFPRERRPQRGGGGGSLPADEFLDNQSQSSLLGHIFRKHVKPKKQHEIRKLGSLVKQLCDQTDCSTVVDVGSGQGHLTRFLSFGLGLSVTAIEADHALVATASKFDGQLLCALEKEGQKENCSSLVPVSHSPPRHVVGWVNPNASWEAFIEQLSAAQLVNESPPTPSGPSKKSPRGSEQVQPPGSHAVETSSRPGSTEPESTEPGSTEPESTEPGSTEPESTEPESTEPESTEPKSTEPESTEPESTEPESTEPGSTEPESTEPKSTEPESTEPESTEPESTEPESTSRRQLTKNEPEEASPDFVLTGLHACGDLSATLLRHFVNCPHVRGITSVACCYMKTTTKENPDPPGLADRDADPSEFGYPMSSWVGGLPGHRLSYKAREGACHAVEDYARRLREGSEALRTHCYRAALETFIADARPDLRRAGIQTIKKAHLLPFTEYARLGLARVGLPPGLPLDPEQVEAMLKQQNRVVVYFSLALLLAPAVETLVLLDRMIYLRENGVDSQLVPLFDPNVSPRNFVLVALKPRLL